MQPILVRRIGHDVPPGDDLAGPIWDSATWHDGFRIIGEPEQTADPDSAVAVVHDGKTLHLGLRALEPLKITSAMESPRRCLAELSPRTQRTASMTLDFPQPLGPTIPIRLLGKWIVVGSTKDLNPASLILLRRIPALLHGRWP